MGSWASGIALMRPGPSGRNVPLNGPNWGGSVTTTGFCAAAAAEYRASATTAARAKLRLVNMVEEYRCWMKEGRGLEFEVIWNHTTGVTSLVDPAIAANGEAGASGPQPQWLDRLDGMPGVALAFLWGLAEGTFFFVVPDVVISLAALLRPGRAWG